MFSFYNRLINIFPAINPCRERRFCSFWGFHSRACQKSDLVLNQGINNKWALRSSTTGSCPSCCLEQKFIDTITHKKQWHEKQDKACWHAGCQMSLESSRIFTKVFFQQNGVLNLKPFTMGRLYPELLCSTVMCEHDLFMFRKIGYEGVAERPQFCLF